MKKEESPQPAKKRPQRRLRRKWILLPAGVLFLVCGLIVVRGLEQGKRFRSGPTFPAFERILNGKFPDAWIARHLVFRKGTPKYDKTVAMYVWRIAPTLPDRDAWKQLVDKHISKVPPDVVWERIHLYPFDQPPEDAASRIVRATEAGYPKAVELLRRHPELGPKVADLMTSGWSSMRARGEIIGGVTPEEKRLIRALVASSPSAAVGLMESWCKINRFGPMKLLSGASVDTTSLMDLIEERFIVGDDLRKLDSKLSRELVESTTVLSPSTGLLLVQKSIPAPEETQLRLVSQTRCNQVLQGFSDGILRGANARIEGEDPRIDRENLKAAWHELVTDSTRANLFASLFSTETYRELGWELLSGEFGEDSESEPPASEILGTFISRVQTASSDAWLDDASIQIEMSERMLEDELHGGILHLIEYVEPRTLAADLTARVWSEQPGTTFAKDCVITCANRGFESALPFLEKTFTGELPPTRDIDWLRALENTKPAEEYCRITGKSSYNETGKCWPPVTVKDIHHEKEISALRSFILNYPWFPGVDDAYYRLAFLHLVQGDRQACLRTLSEAFEYGFVENDCHYYLAQVFRIAIDGHEEIPEQNGLAGELAYLYRNPLGVIILDENPRSRMERLQESISTILNRNSHLRFCYLQGKAPLYRPLLNDLDDLIDTIVNSGGKDPLEVLMNRLERFPDEYAAALLFYLDADPELTEPPDSPEYYQPTDLPSLEGPDSYFEEAVGTCLERLAGVSEPQDDASKIAYGHLLGRYHELFQERQSVDAPPGLQARYERMEAQTDRLSEQLAQIESGADEETELPGDQKPAEMVLSVPVSDPKPPAEEAMNLDDYRDSVKTAIRKMLEALPDSSVSAENPLEDARAILLIDTNGTARDVVVLSPSGEIRESPWSSRLSGIRFERPPLPESYAFYRIMINLKAAETTAKKEGNAPPAKDESDDASPEPVDSSELGSPELVSPESTPLKTDPPEPAR